MKGGIFLYAHAGILPASEGLGKGKGAEQAIEKELSASLSLLFAPVEYYVYTPSAKSFACLASNPF